MIINYYKLTLKKLKYCWISQLRNVKLALLLCWFCFWRNYFCFDY